MVEDATVSVRVLDDGGDDRGPSYPIPSSWREFLGDVVDIHLTSIEPGKVRGNHFHVLRREMLIVIHRDNWLLYWDEGKNSQVRERAFTGAGAVLLQIFPGSSHALANVGSRELLVLGLSNGEFDPDKPDSYPRQVI